MRPEASPETRRRVAAEALGELVSYRSDRQRLSVQCPRSHHVANVYDTDACLVCWTVTGPHAHGSRDFVDTAHHGQRRGSEYVDLLEAGPLLGDDLPAWCECGPRTLSRSELRGCVVANQRTLRLS